MKMRAGAALLELITAAVLLGIVGIICTTLIHAQASLIRTVSEHIAVAETLRSARTIVARDVRILDSADIHAVAGDSISIRVFRGWGIVCAAANGIVTVRYQGLRQPDATKDSMLVFGEDRAGTFQGTSPLNSDCPRHPDEQILGLSPSISVRAGALLLFYETGAYHLAVNALRYRRGNEGRQPLTDELIDHRRSSFALESGRGIRFVLRSNPTVGAPARSSNSHVRFLNQP